jgi:hypothetical protein
MNYYFDSDNFDPRYLGYQTVIKYKINLEWDSEVKKEKSLNLIRQQTLGSIFIKPRFKNVLIQNEYYRPRNPMLVYFPWFETEKTITLVDEEVVFIIDGQEFNLIQGLNKLITSVLDPAGLTPRGSIEIEETFPRVESKIEIASGGASYSITYHELDKIEEIYEGDQIETIPI